MFSIWHDTALMEKLARVLWRVAALLLLFAGLTWVLQRPYFAINQFRFVGDVQQIEEPHLNGLLKKHLSDGLSGGFFSMDLDNVQSSLKDISWIKSTSIRRVWPHEIEVNITAYQPISVWAAGGYLSADGHVFEVNLSDEQKHKLMFTSGPDKAAELVASKAPLFEVWLKPMGWRMSKLTLTERYSWNVTLDNGLNIEFGREDTPTMLEERAHRLQLSEKFIKSNLSAGETNAYIDLRYPNGFAMRTQKLRRTNNGGVANAETARTHTVAAVAAVAAAPVKTDKKVAAKKADNKPTATKRKTSNAAQP